MNSSKWRKSLLASLNSIHNFYDKEGGKNISTLDFLIEKEINNLMRTIDITGLSRLDKQSIKVYDSGIKNQSGMLLLTIYSMWVEGEKKLNSTDSGIAEANSKLHRYLSRLKLIEEMEDSRDYTIREEVPLLTVFEILTTRSN